MAFDGLTVDGLDVPRAADFWDEIRSSIQAQYDKNINFTENSFFGPVVLEMALQLDSLAEILLEVYNARSLNNARGLQLDELVSLSGITREPSQPSRIAQQQFTGDYLTEVPLATRVAGGGPDGSLEWELVEDLVLGILVEVRFDGSGTWELVVNAPANAPDELVSYNASSSDTISDIATGLKEAMNTNDQVRGVLNSKLVDLDGDGDPEGFVASPLKGQDADIATGQTPQSNTGFAIEKGRNVGIVEAVEHGPYVAEKGAVDTLVDSVTGLGSTTNLVDAEIGRERESDDELRLRHREQIQLPGTAAAEAIRAAVFQVEPVDSAVVLENDRDTQQTIGNVDLPESSTAVFVWPNTLTDDELDRIARQIYQETPVGIEVASDSSFTVLSRDVEKPDGQIKTIRFHYAQQIGVTFDVTVSLEAGFELSDVDPPIDDAIRNYVGDLLVGDNVRRLPIYAAIDAIDGIKSVDQLQLNGVGDDLLIQASEIASVSAVNVQ